jgi:hypothetical protein
MRRIDLARGDPSAQRPTRAGEPRGAKALGVAALVGGGGLTLVGLSRLRTGRDRRKPPATPPAAEAAGLFAATGLLALSVLADSAVEHYRGEFRNPGMYAPLASSAAILSLAAMGLRRGALPSGAGIVFAAGGAVGAAGLGFHLFNIRKRPGRFNWLNLFYAAPIGAPAALGLAGVMGLLAQAVARGRRLLLGLSLGRVSAGLTALGLAGTVGEAGLLHFRGAFQNPFMWLPVSLPPVGAALLAGAACDGGAGRRRFTRAWLALTAALGLGGVGFHIFGVSRAMGGWRNWRQNLVDGPPIPAPPAFTALSLAGLAALALQRREAESAA